MVTAGEKGLLVAERCIPRGSGSVFVSTVDLAINGILLCETRDPRSVQNAKLMGPAVSKKAAMIDNDQ
jgi:hypothetical protein